jgi:hypothetical protein
MFTRTLQLALVGLMVAATSFSQEQTESTGADAADDMGEKCQMMQDRMQEMHQKHEQMRSELDAAVSKMNDAEGEERVDAIIVAFNQLVEKQKAMHEMHAQMMDGMMTHMAQHMSNSMNKGARKEMMQCPMMGQMMSSEGSESKGEKKSPAGDDHSTHH